MEQYFKQPATQSESSQGSIDKWESVSAGAARLENTSSGGFDCNICLDTVHDPVVTFCGHLYCWPCIYKWIHSQRASSEDPDQQPQCPVCKEGISEGTLIPLYGPGQSTSPSDNGKDVPQRPNGPGCGVHTLIATTTTTSSHPSHQLHHHNYPFEQVNHPYYSMAESPGFGFAGTTTFHPMIGMFGEMISAHIFGNSQGTLYTSPNTYSAVTRSSARARRHMMLVDRSLSRVSFFLLCGTVLCLLLF